MRPSGKSSRKCLQAGTDPITYDESGRVVSEEARCSSHNRSGSKELSGLIILVMNEAERSFVHRDGLHGSKVSLQLALILSH